MDLFSFLREQDVEIKQNFPLQQKTSAHVGGIVACAVFPRNEEQALRLFRYCDEKGISYRVFGRMSNTCPKDQPMQSLFVFTDRMNDVAEVDGKLSVSAGMMLSRLCNRWRTMPELSGIPGSVGGSIRQNAGAFGLEIGNRLISARIYSKKTGKTETISSDMMDFSYRTSRCADGNEIVLSALFQIVKESDYDRKKAEFLSLRRQTQPTDAPSFGSTFRRVGNMSAGFWVERAGCKGLQIGGAKVSEKHAGFFINNGNATASDWKALTTSVQETVFRKFSVRLVPEIEFL